MFCASSPSVSDTLYLYRSGLRLGAAVSVALSRAPGLAT